MARKLVNTKEITHDQWLALRRQSLGGSDSGICVNMNQYESLIELYSKKKGLVKDTEDNEAMRQGRDLEQYVADRFMEATGKKVINDHFMYLDDEYDFISANFDRKVVGESAGLECKTMNSFNGYNLAAGEIPEHYYCQLQHYCMVMNWTHIYIGILVYQRAFYWHKVDRNDDFIKTLREAETAFWTQYMMQDRIPEPDGSESSIATLKELYPHGYKDVAITVPSLDRRVRDYYEKKSIADDFSKQAEQIKASICKDLGKAEIGLGVDYGVTWKNQSRTSGYDMDRLQRDYPNIDISKYKKITEFRQFRVQDYTKKKEKKK